MALVNTVTFRGVWQKQFLFTNTQNLPFILSDGSAIKVPMMYQATEVSFGKRCHPSIYPSKEEEQIPDELMKSTNLTVKRMSSIWFEEILHP